MNESIFLRYRRNGVDVPVTAFDRKRGVELAGETSAPPIGFRFQITPGHVAEFQLDAIRRVEDWQPHEQVFTVALEDGGIRLRGGGKRRPERSLPPGRYEILLGLADIKLEETQFDIDVPSGGEATVVVEEKADRQFRFFNDPGFEPATFGILAHPESGLDGMPVLNWIVDPLRRTARKCCLLNVLAKLRSLGLAAHVDSIAHGQIDRVYFRAKPSLFDELKKSASFTKDSGPLDGTHIAVAHERLGANFKRYEIISFREEVARRSMQIIVNQPDSSDLPTFAEMDIDLFNPKIDAASLFGHVGELLDSGKTDHVALFDRLSNDGLDDFLYYKLERAQGANR